MSLIGIIPNPSSGKDIRRLVSEASGMDNREKVNIVRRVLRGIDVLGVERVLIMPDPYGIGHFAMDRLSIATPVDLLEMEVFSTPNDSRRAAARMCEMGATCLVVLGGDGTNRMVAQVSGDVPVLPISTGTNNVWPQPTWPPLWLPNACYLWKPSATVPIGWKSASVQWIATSAKTSPW